MAARAGDVHGFFVEICFDVRANRIAAVAEVMVEKVVYNLIAGEHHSVFFFLELPGVKALAAADFAADQKYFCHAFLHYSLPFQQ